MLSAGCIDLNTPYAGIAELPGSSSQLRRKNALKPPSKCCKIKRCSIRSYVVSGLQEFINNKKQVHAGFSAGSRKGAHWKYHTTMWTHVSEVTLATKLYCFCPASTPQQFHQAGQCNPISCDTYPVLVCLYVLVGDATAWWTKTNGCMPRLVLVSSAEGERMTRTNRGGRPTAGVKIIFYPQITRPKTRTRHHIPKKVRVKNNLLGWDFLHD